MHDKRLLPGCITSDELWFFRLFTWTPQVIEVESESPIPTEDAREMGKFLARQQTLEEKQVQKSLQIVKQQIEHILDEDGDEIMLWTEFEQIAV